ncbi:MAG: hypothetical protein J6B81_00145 [Spirochaetaceae bacterium]|nr:hypothetical protein [Spirochaetaceae bacterium]
MEEQNTPKKQPVYRYEPGELDKTRKNIGSIDQEEALKMTKILGGEIGFEKSAPVDEVALKKVRSAMKTRNLRNGERKSRSYDNTEENVQDFVTSEKSSVSSQFDEAKPVERKDVLPAISPKERNKIDKLMMSPDYKIKQSYGIFNFFAVFTKGGQEKIAPMFITISAKNYVLRIRNFQTNVKELINLSPESYRNKIASGDEPKYMFLRTVSSWNVEELEESFRKLERNSSSQTITSMIPFVRQIYRLLLTLYFLGETKSAELLQVITAELRQYPDVKKDRVQSLIREIAVEWSYLYNRVIKGMYPLLLRMCCSEYMDFQQLMTKQLPKVFGFLGMTKFDVVLPQKKPAEPNLDVAKAEKTEEEQIKEQQKKAIEKKEIELVQSGIKVLDRIFPGAGWLEIENLPDMYPFFQPLYSFPDGLNLLSPKNPLQITIILIKIIEDLLEGCRNIGLVEDSSKNDAKSVLQADSLAQVMNDWSAYRETLFDKLYVPYLKDFVNKLYSQKDFAYSQYGKRLISNMQWHTFYNYLPHLKFEQLLLEKPSNESKMRPLSLRVSLLVSELKRITVAADNAVKNETSVQEIANILEPYSFDIPNVVSHRIDVLLGARRGKEKTKATNLNLLKYTLSVAAVLNWWISDKDSPAYVSSDIPICRTSEKDGSPVFSVQGREDQNTLFVQSVKAAAAAKAGAAKA